MTNDVTMHNGMIKIRGTDMAGVYQVSHIILSDISAITVQYEEMTVLFRNGENIKMVLDPNDIRTAIEYWVVCLESFQNVVKE